MMNPYDPQTVGYHLFFEPVGTLRESLQRDIARLANEFDSPIFEPHVTLLARIPDALEGDLLRTAETLAGQLSPVEIEIAGLGMEDRYFRALYAFVEPRDVLTQMHGKAATAFGMPETPGYVPHLSLLYGNYPEEQKHAAFPDFFAQEGSRFTADKLHLWRTPGEASSWERIATFPLLG